MQTLREHGWMQILSPRRSACPCKFLCGALVTGPLIMIAALFDPVVE